MSPIVSMQNRFITFILLFFSLLQLQAVPKMSRDEVLDSLDKYLDQQEYYDTLARKRIDRMAGDLSRMRGHERALMRERIISDYMHINVDSALHQIVTAEAEARAANDTLALMRLQFLRLQAFPIKSMLHKSLDALEKINGNTLPQPVRRYYYRDAAQVYDYARDMNEQPDDREYFVKKSRLMMDSMLMYIPEDEFLHKYYKASSRLNSVGGAEAVTELTMMLDSLSRSDLLYARIAAEIANYYSKRGNNPERAEFFYALSAISDIVTGNTETTSLHRLGTLLYDRNDIDRAVKYLTVSLSRSVKSGARIRALEIAEALPLVLSAAKQRDSIQRRNLMIVLVCIGIVAMMLIAAVVVLWIQRGKLARMRQMLDRRHRIKDEYIRQLLSLCAVYMQGMSDMNKLTTRKLKAKQYQDLLEMLESGKLMRQQLQTFYEVFDDAVLNSYPDFIPGVNRLLQPDMQFHESDYKDGLNTELRMLAFMQLGIEDSQELAKFLGLSVNSVYTYRNRLKSRAINRDTFEENIRKLTKIY